MRRNCPSPSRICPRNRCGAVYGSGDGTSPWSTTPGKDSRRPVGGLNGTSSSVFVTRNQSYVFAASQTAHVFTVVNQTHGGSPPSQPSRRLPRQRESRRVRRAGLRAELQLCLLSAAAHCSADQSLTPEGPPPGPKPPWTASLRMSRHGASSRCKAPTTRTRISGNCTTALR